MTHDAFVKKIAKTYFDKYFKEGYDKAAAYAQRVFVENPELKQDIKVAINNLILQKRGKK